MAWEERTVEQMREAIGDVPVSFSSRKNCSEKAACRPANAGRLAKERKNEKVLTDIMITEGSGSCHLDSVKSL